MNGSSMRIRVAAGLCSAALILGGCANTPDASATLVNINKGEDKIPFGYGNFVAHFNQAQYDEYYVQFYGNTNYWAQSTGDENTINALTVEEDVKDNIMYDMKENYVSTKHAPDYNLKITDEEQKKIEKAADKFLEDNSEEVIKAMGATRDYLIQYMTESTYNKKLQHALEEEGEKTLKDEDVVQTSYSYIHLYRDESTDNPEETRSDEELKAAAEAISASKDFEAAAKEQNAEVDNDAFAKAMTAKEAAEEYNSPIEVIKAVKALKNEGDVSPVIPVEGSGFYVVRLDHLEDKDETEAERENKISIYYTDTFNEMKNDIDWEVDEKLWEKVDFEDVLFADVNELSEESSEEDASEAEEDGTDETTDEASDESDEDSKEDASEESGKDSIVVESGEDVIEEIGADDEKDADDEDTDKEATDKESEEDDAEE